MPGLRNVGVRLQADVAGYIASMRAAKGATTDFVGSLDKAARAGKLDAVADQAGRMGFVLAGAFAGVVAVAAKFEKAMSGVSAATHASASDLHRLSDAALQAGKDTKFSATDAANGIEELAKAGVSTADILGGGLRGALDLAAAGEISVGSAAETAASAMTQFKLSGRDLPHVADLLAAGAGKAQGSVDDMAMALKQGGLVAAQMGLSIEETTGTLASFASAGLIGSDAGTSFKTMLLRLAAPSKEAAAAMDELGINAFDAQGKFVGMAKFSGILQTALSGLTDEQRNAALATIFGSDAIRAGSIAYQQGQKGIQGWIDKTNDAGYAADTAARKTDNLMGDIERLTGSLETLAIESGSGANVGLRKLAQGAEALVNQFSSLPPAAGAIITVLAGVGGALLLGAAAWVKMRHATADALTELRNTGPAGARAAAGLEATTKWAGRAAAAFVALQVAGAVLSSFRDSSADVDRLNKSLQDFAATGKVAGESQRVFGAGLKDFGHDARAAGDSWFPKLGRAIEALIPGTRELNELISGGSWTGSAERIQAVDDAMVQLLATAGKADALKVWNELLLKSGMNSQDLIKLMPGFEQALKDVEKGSTGTAGAVKGVGTAAKDAADKMTEMRIAAEKLVEGVLTARGANRDFEEAIDDATAAVKENGRTLDINTAKGRANQTALDHIASSAINAAGKVRDLNGSQKDINTIMERGRAKFLEVAGAMGLDARRARELADKLFGIPDVTVDYRTRGYKDVLSQVWVLGQAQRALEQATAVKNLPKFSDLISGNIRRAQGGPIEGPGTKTSDSVLLWGSRGEFMQPAASVDYYGEGAMEALRTRKIPKEALGQYARGGLIAPYPVDVSVTRLPTKAQAQSKVPGFAAGGAGGPGRAGPGFPPWPASPAAQRGDTGVWLSILRLVNNSGIPYTFGNAYRPGDPLYHGSGRAIDFMGYNQDRLANFFMARMSNVLELIHRTNQADYGVTRGHRSPMYTQWPLHRNHLHVAMGQGGIIDEPVHGVGRSGKTYSFAERGPETVIPGRRGGTTVINVTLHNAGVIGTRMQTEEWLASAANALQRQGRL